MYRHWVVDIDIERKADMACTGVGVPSRDIVPFFLIINFKKAINLFIIFCYQTL